MDLGSRPPLPGGVRRATSPEGAGGGGGGGPVGQVTVGNNFFRSAHNGSQNPAVDTIAAGGSVTWTWNAAGSHSIQSTGTPGDLPEQRGHVRGQQQLFGDVQHSGDLRPTNAGCTDRP